MNAVQGHSEPGKYSRKPRAKEQFHLQTREQENCTHKGSGTEVQSPSQKIKR